MSFSYIIQENSDISTLELNGDLSIENIEDFKKVLDEFLELNNKLEISNIKIYKLDLPFLQLLVAAKKQAEKDGKSLSIKDDFIQDLNIFIEFSGLRELIF
jgi:ABC-type transporter Mla MlaB component